ncbi:hypothetical protein SteCoe_20408 [Stentor coeruleus]|uniref:Uncharacterized protein n=1 Tax=Stentor coeruleus TaxID=5963 RepID=A0A1R2BS34_9CILI|nr:hypothetical protein SteCoe_20408 [Stentor coeruleus]
MLATPKWIYSDSNFIVNTTLYDTSTNMLFYSYRFKGGIIRCKDGCSDSYGNLSSDWCAKYDSLDADDIESVCKMFVSLYWGAVICVFFEAVCFIAIAVWSATMACYMNKVNSIFMTFCCSICVLICHYIAILAWLEMSGASYSDDCSSVPTNGETIPLCGSHGPGLGLFLMVFIPAVVVLYFAVACRIKTTHGFNGFGGKLEPIEPEVKPKEVKAFPATTVVYPRHVTSIGHLKNEFPDHSFQHVPTDQSSFQPVLTDQSSFIKDQNKSTNN